MRNIILLVIISFFSIKSLGSDKLAINKISQVIGKLTESKPECIYYQVYKEDEKFYYIKVRENHALKGCGGDNNVSPILFNAKVSKDKLDIYTDKDDLDGYYHLLE